MKICWNEGKAVESYSVDRITIQNETVFMWNKDKLIRTIMLSPNDIATIIKI
jgi:hypothetical protein